MTFAGFCGLSLLLASMACEAPAPTAQGPRAQPVEEKPVKVLPASSAPAGDPPGSVSERSFGAPLALTQATPVADVLADPTPHLGKVVQCTGVIARVCERAGCWLELRPEGSTQEGLRVPMARHAFFIPQDAVGRSAKVEGELTARALGAGERAHLESEGLRAVGPLSLSATGVVIR